MLVTGHQNTGEDGMNRSAVLGMVATIGLAGDDRRTQHTLCPVVGRLQVVDRQET